MLCCKESKDSDYVQLEFAKVLVLVGVGHQRYSASIRLKMSKIALRVSMNRVKNFSVFNGMRFSVRNVCP